jgi:hypothetical protein
MWAPNINPAFQGFPRCSCYKFGSPKVPSHLSAKKVHRFCVGVAIKPPLCGRQHYHCTGHRKEIAYIVRKTVNVVSRPFASPQPSLHSPTFPNTLSNPLRQIPLGRKHPSTHTSHLHDLPHSLLLPRPQSPHFGLVRCDSNDEPPSSNRSQSHRHNPQPVSIRPESRPDSFYPPATRNPPPVVDDGREGPADVFCGESFGAPKRGRVPAESAVEAVYESRAGDSDGPRRGCRVPVRDPFQCADSTFSSGCEYDGRGG